MEHTASRTDGMVALAGGRFRIGSDDRFAYPDDGETPREFELSPFAIDRCAVSNAAFAQFVESTGYVTDAERFGWSFVFAGLLPDDFPPTRAIAQAPWWRQVHGATWDHPEGPASSIEDRADHPVVHVSQADALAFCAWAGLRLPTEAEWEFAARGGLEGATYAWGDEFAPGGELMANTWQGEFPWQNLLQDGYAGTSPVGAFPANGYGLHDMTGNVWEWTVDPFESAPSASPCCGGASPAPGERRLVIKGGSHLCAPSYCLRYRPAARQSETPDTSTSHLGFRCIVRA
jgi:formylglycine-generating enzyme